MLEDHVLYAVYVNIIRNMEGFSDDLIRYHEKTKARIIKNLMNSEEITDLTVNHKINIGVSISLNKKSLGFITNCFG